MSTIKSKRRKKKRTRRIQRGGGFFDDLKKKFSLSYFGISDPINSMASRFRGSFCPPCPPCPKPESISPSPDLPKKSENISDPLVKIGGGSDNKKRRTKKNEFIKNNLHIKSNQIKSNQFH